jgi:hypothetical protein
LVFTLAASAAQAHDPGLSTLALHHEGSKLSLRLTLALRDAACLLAAEALSGEAPSQPAPRAAGRPSWSDLASRAQQGLEVAVDGKTVLPEASLAWVDSEQNATVRLVYPVAGTAVSMRSALAALLPFGHRHHVVVTGAGGETVLERLLDARNDRIAVTLSAPLANTGVPAEASPSGSAVHVQLLALGCEHVLLGYDHLLFVLALVITGLGFGAAAALITSFSAAHFVTLALAAFDIVHVRAEIVEPLIAASIIWVAMENLCRPPRRARWRIAFACGLVHGLGFASSFRDLDIGASSNPMLALLSFHVGVEAAQVAIVALVVPTAHWLRHRREHLHARLAAAISMAIFAAGSYWLLEHTVLGALG